MTRIGDGFGRSPIGQVPGAGEGKDLLTTQVQPGETTLQQVAQRLKTLLDLLQKLNPQIREPNRLQAGQEVRYPAQGAMFPSPVQAEPQAPAAGELQSRSLESRMESALARQQLDSNQGPQAAAPGSSGIPPYDPARGPVITNDMWTEEMLTGEVTSDQLRNIVDPAAFLNARMERMRQPTTAHWVDNLTGATQMANPAQMSTKEQADAMLERLRALGYSGEGVVERRPENPFSRIDYGNDPRRHYYIGDMSVGLLAERYAKYPKETADAMTLAELRQAGG